MKPPSLNTQILLGAMLGIALLAGCAAWGGGTEGAQNSWNGARYDDVASQWGASTRSAALADGQVAHTWVSSTARHGGLFGIFGGSGGVGAGVAFPLPGMGGGEQMQCERTLTFKDGYVVRQAWYGPDDICSPFKRR